MFARDLASRTNPEALCQPQATGPPSGHGATFSALAATEHAPWLFVGDNRGGGVDTPCGI
ncbi:MAG: hypothetical protein ACYCS7_09970 [Acidimicrobiales bacterium]